MKNQKGNAFATALIVLVVIVLLAWEPLRLSMASSKLDEPGVASAEHAAMMFEAEGSTAIDMPTGLWKQIRNEGKAEISQSIAISENGRFNWNVKISKEGKEKINKSLTGTFSVKGSTLVADSLDGALGFLPKSKRVVVDTVDHKKLVLVDYTNNNKSTYFKTKL